MSAPVDFASIYDKSDKIFFTNVHRPAVSFLMNLRHPGGQTLLSSITLELPLPTLHLFLSCLQMRTYVRMWKARVWRWLDNGRKDLSVRVKMEESAGCPIGRTIGSIQWILDYEFCRWLIWCMRDLQKLRDRKNDIERSC